MFDPSQIKKDLDAVIITVPISQSQFALNCQLLAHKASGGGRERGTPLYKLFRYVPPHRVWFLRRFGLKFLRELRDCSKKEKEVYEFEMHLKNFFVCAVI